MDGNLDPALRSETSYSQRPFGANIPYLTTPDPAGSSAPHTSPQYPNLQDGSPHTLYTPQSAEPGHELEEPNEGHDGNPNDAKRPRACEACRGLKVRCEFDSNNTDAPCKRCAKANRNCVVTVPSRKRQKKTDSRVAELEKKIDALTASLAQKSGSASENGVDQESVRMLAAVRQNPYQQVTNGGYDAPYSTRPDARMSSEWAGYPRSPEYDLKKTPVPPMVVAGQKRKHAEIRDYPSPDARPASTGGQSRKPMDQQPQLQSYFSEPGVARILPAHEYADVVDRNMVSMEQATSMFNTYVEKMAPHMPAVVFPSGTTAAEIRKSKPVLFLAILGASAGLNSPELQRILTKEVMNVFATRIICNGDKTLELIQALHISTLWYWPPEHFEELKFYQLIHIAAVMAIDIGLGKKSKSSKSKQAGLWRDHAWRRTPYPDPESVEARRAWLSCYFLCCNASMGLRRPNLIRWTNFMADCVDFLEQSPEAVYSDKTLCQWVRSQHIAEEIGTQFAMDDPMATVSISDSKVQYALKGFERDLSKWSSQIPADIQSTTLKMTEHVVNLYMHEVAMHVDHNVDEFKPPFTETDLRNVGEDTGSLTPAHISALSTCLTSIDGIFETFMKFDVETIRCLPVAHFVRVAYAVVVLIKMYFSAATPNSELGKVIDKNNMKVEQYLDGLVAVFQASAAHEKSRPSAKFLMVLIMLKTWFHRQREGKVSQSSGTEAASAVQRKSGGESAESVNESQQKDSAPLTQQRHGQQSSYSPANTPLQLLSEVATGNSGGQSRSGSISSHPGASNEWQGAQNFSSYNQPLILNQMPTHTLDQVYRNNIGGNIDPSLGMDLGNSMGDGFEQAMGLTLGVGDFGGYFSDDAFFGNIMDSVGGGPGFDGF